MIARGRALTSDFRIIQLTVDTDRHAHLKQAIEDSLGHPLPEFDQLHSDDNCSLAIRKGRCDWLLIGPPAEVSARHEDLHKLLSGAAAVISDVSDSFVAFENLDRDSVVFWSGVELRNGQAKLLRIRQTSVVAFCIGDQSTVLVPRSFQTIPGF
jgi:hypothetical protein